MSLFLIKCRFHCPTLTFVKMWHTSYIYYLNLIPVEGILKNINLGLIFPHWHYMRYWKKMAIWPSFLNFGEDKILMCASWHFKEKHCWVLNFFWQGCNDFQFLCTYIINSISVFSPVPSKLCLCEWAASSPGHTILTWVNEHHSTYKCKLCFCELQVHKVLCKLKHRDHDLLLFIIYKRNVTNITPLLFLRNVLKTLLYCHFWDKQYTITLLNKATWRWREPICLFFYINTDLHLWHLPFDFDLSWPFALPLLTFDRLITSTHRLTFRPAPFDLWPLNYINAPNKVKMKQLDVEVSTPANDS